MLIDVHITLGAIYTSINSKSHAFFRKLSIGNIHLTIFDEKKITSREGTPSDPSRNIWFIDTTDCVKGLHLITFSVPLHLHVPLYISNFLNVAHL